MNLEQREENEMKRMMVMVAVALASVMALSATVEFLGVEVGGTLDVQDAKVC